MEREMIALIFLILTVTRTSSTTCPKDTYLNNHNLCCQLCPEGTYLVTPCNKSLGQSTCEPCPSSTFMSKKNKEPKCERCKSCAPSQTELTPCSKVKNTECVCEADKYFDSGLLYCMECRKCGEGEGVVKECEGSQNTACEACKKGTSFSDTKNSKDPCVMCSSCDPPVMAVKEPCTVTKDTICERVRNQSQGTTPTQTFPTGPIPTSHSRHRPSDLTGSDGESDPVMWIIISLAVLVVITGVVVLFYCKKVLCFRSEDGNEPQVTQAAEETECPFIPQTTLQTPAQSRSSHGLRGRRIVNSSRNGRESDSQGSSGSLQGVSIGNGKKQTPITDLPYNVYIELGQLLNPKGTNNWEKLAGKLGFLNTQVRNFQLDPGECTQKVLQEWGQRDGSTVEVLIKHLKDMKREDCLGKLKPWDSA